MKLCTKVFILFAILHANTVVAGPFGLDMGMTLKQIHKLTDIKPAKATFEYVTNKLPKSNKAFEKYIIYVSPKNGLCKITAIGNDINTSSHGSELVSSFKAMEAKLTGKYGQNKKYDFLKSESIWSKDNDWTTALKLNERILASFWPAKEDANLIENIKTIMLEASALDQHKGYYVLRYEFKNVDACNEEINIKEGESL